MSSPPGEKHYAIYPGEDWEKRIVIEGSDDLSGDPWLFRLARTHGATPLVDLSTANGRITASYDAAHVDKTGSVVGGTVLDLLLPNSLTSTYLPQPMRYSLSAVIDGKREYYLAGDIPIKNVVMGS